jgi:hypothetical protein
VASAVSLYSTADGAASDIHDEGQDALRSVGKGNSEGLTELDAEEINIEEVGEEAVGLKVTLAESDDHSTPFYGTYAAFWRGNLIGTVLLVRWDQEDLSGEATRLAKILNERVTTVLENE